MGNACSSRKSKDNESKEKEDHKAVINTQDIKFDKSSFVMQNDERFRDNYLVG